MPEHDVVGGGTGNAVLATAVAAREQGAARVRVLEKAPVALRGCNAHYSGGLFHFAFSQVEDTGLMSGTVFGRLAGSHTAGD